MGSKGGESVNPQALCCLVCHEQFDVDEIPKKEKFHERCYEHRFNCYVCDEKFPKQKNGVRKYHWHPFWKKNYCPIHDEDETPKCCSCERLRLCGTDYVTFEDGRRQCQECKELCGFDSEKLKSNMLEFYASLDLTVTQTFPVTLVDKQELLKASKHATSGIRGFCESIEQNVSSIPNEPRMGPEKQLTEMVTKKQQQVRKNVVTKILIINRLPWLLQGSILAHEMMHAWLRLNGYRIRDLKEELEEGLCQMLSLRWLESLTYAFPDIAAASASSSSSSTTPAASTLNKGDSWSDFEKKLLKFCIYQIKEDDSLVYGKGFQQINDIMLQNTNYTIRDAVEEIVRASKAMAIPDANAKVSACLQSVPRHEGFEFDA